jgi:hypothetical protein
MTRTLLPIDRFFADRRLIALDMSSRQTWLTTWKSAYALPLTDAEMQTFARIAGGRRPPTKRVREVWIDVGRRGGKSEQAAAIAIHSALFVKHKLSRGEVGMVLVVAGTRDQAGVVFNYIREFLDGSPTLKREVVNVKAEEITLRNGIVIAVHSNSFRTIRGRTLVAAIFDEVAFWRDETSTTPDIEVYRAVMPALANTKGILIGLSTPYRKFGLLYSKYRDHFGVDGDDVLVVQGATQVFNPTLDEAEIAAQRRVDPTSANSEWDAEFRDDVGSLLDDETIDFATDLDRPLELPPASTGYYKAFTDSAGGSGGDAYTLCIGHKKGDQFVVDVIRGTSGKYDPQQVTELYAALLKEYRITSVTGDYYSAEWCAAAWRKCGITYIKSDIAKSQIYLECIPLFTRGLVRLPNHPKLLRELRLLERHTHRSGKDHVDHGRGGSDDYANSVCGCLHGLSARFGYTLDPFQPGFRDRDLPPVAEPEPLPPPQANGNWWKSMPRSQPTSAAADRTRDFYSALDQASRTGCRDEQTFHPCPIAP